MSINIEQLVEDMVEAMHPIIEAHWDNAVPYVKAEAEKLATVAAQIEAGYAAGTMTKEEADILRDMQASAARAFLTSVETIGAITAQNAINAALNVMSEAVNKALGIALL